MKTWCKKNDGKIVDVTLTSGKEPSYGEGWMEVPNNWGGAPGDELKWFGEDMRRIPDEELVKKGVRKDHRNKKFFKKNNMGETKKVLFLDEEAGEEYTDQEPLAGDGSDMQKWDEQSQAWVVDNAGKEKSEAEKELGEIQSKITDIEARCQRPSQEILVGIDEEENRKWLLKYRDEVADLRARKTKLENKLNEEKTA